MPQVQITDIYNPATFGGLVQQRQDVLNRIVNAGATFPDVLVITSPDVVTPSRAQLASSASEGSMVVCPRQTPVTSAPALQ